MITKRPVFYIRTIFALMAGILLFAWTSNVYADTAQTQLSVAPNGQVMMRGAKVVALHGTLATVETSWGETSFRWTVELTGSTRYVPDMKSADAIAAISVGDTVNITGSLDTSRAVPTLIASVFKDMSHYEEGATIAGSVLSVDTKAQALVIQNDAGTTTIDIFRGTIITKDGNRATLGDIDAGMTVSAIGSLNRISNMLSAERLAIAAQPVSKGTGFFSGILAWFQGSRGALSVRDR